MTEKVEATPEVDGAELFDQLPLKSKIAGLLLYIVTDLLGMGWNVLQHLYRSTFITGLVTLVAYPIATVAAKQYGFSLPTSLQTWMYLLAIGLVVRLYQS